MTEGAIEGNKGRAEWLTGRGDGSGQGRGRAGEGIGGQVEDNGRKIGTKDRKPKIGSKGKRRKIRREWRRIGLVDRTEKDSEGTRRK